MKISKKYLALAVAASFFAAGGAYAATQSVDIDMSFDTALTLTNPTPIDFGILQALTSGTYTVDTTGALSTGGGGVAIGGSPNAGVVHITGSTTQTVAISTGSYVADGNVTPSAATCLYNSVLTTDCDTGVTGALAPGAGQDLTLGVTISADGSQTAGSTPAPSFTVTVIYG
ncbi:MAG: DUF4402 domain-containing protein [Proteobacteria bacterium]|jgi:hypothetical protein|nr:DUF4402 domain-containing protein [Alphaproteobacteria bacterium]NCC03325.1 DUF4402 domain-containing protein [Pseudomonadota bacterium]